MPSSKNSPDTLPLDCKPCFSKLFPARIATSLNRMHLPCHIGLVQLLIVCPHHSSSNTWEQCWQYRASANVWVQCQGGLLLMQCQLRGSAHTLYTNIGGESSFGRWKFEGIIKGCQASIKYSSSLSQTLKYWILAGAFWRSWAPLIKSGCLLQGIHLSMW